MPPIAGGAPRPKIDLPLDQIQQLYLEGWTRKDIAHELNVSPATIRDRLAEIHQQPPNLEDARAFIEAFLDSRFERQHEKKVFNRLLDEANRLDDLYPGLFDEVYQDLKKQR